MTNTAAKICNVCQIDIQWPFEELFDAFMLEMMATFYIFLLEDF